MSNGNNYIEMTFPAKMQKHNYDCGSACMESILTFFGFSDLEDKVFNIAGTNKQNGTFIKGLARVAKKFGVRYKTFTNMSVDDLKNYIDRHFPVIIAIQAYSRKSQFQYNRSWAHGHYVIPIGYDDKKIYFQDPSSTVRTFLTYQELNERWHDVDVDGKKLIHFGMVIFGPSKTRKKHMK